MGSSKRLWWGDISLTSHSTWYVSSQTYYVTLGILLGVSFTVLYCQRTTDQIDPIEDTDSYDLTIRCILPAWSDKIIPDVTETLEGETMSRVSWKWKTHFENPSYNYYVCFFFFAELWINIFRYCIFSYVKTKSLIVTLTFESRWTTLRWRSLDINQNASRNYDTWYCHIPLTDDRYFPHFSFQ